MKQEKRISEIKAIGIALTCIHKAIEELESHIISNVVWALDIPVSVKVKEDLLNAFECLKNMREDMADKKFVPIFERDGYKFYILQSDFVGEDEEEARNIGKAAMLNECAVLDMKFCEETKEIETTAVPSRILTLHPYQIAIIGCPEDVQEW